MMTSVHDYFIHHLIAAVVICTRTAQFQANNIPEWIGEKHPSSTSIAGATGSWWLLKEGE